MISISEFLPNPKGSDAAGEWIELANNGASSVSLRGWTLATEGGKKISLSQEISGNGFLLLPRTATKLTLKNESGGLSLRDAAGKLTHRLAFVGQAPEGQSVNARPDGGFYFTVPTPKAANAAPPTLAFAAETIPFGVPLNAARSALDVVFLGVGAAAFIAILLVMAVKNHADLSELFFGRN